MAKPLETLTESELRLERESLQNAKSLTDIEKQRLQFILDRISALEEERSKTKDLANSLSNLLKLQSDQSNQVKSTVISFKELGESASNLYKIVLNLKNPSSIFLQLLNLSVDRFIELDKAGQAFRETTGFLADQTLDVEMTLRRTSRDLATFGVNVENANNAAQKIAETFSSVSLVTDEIVGHVALMEKNLGVSIEDSTSVMQNFMGIGKLSSDIANKTAGAALSLAKAAGVPFAKVMKDVSSAGGEVFKLVRGSVDALIKGAIEARRLGIELKDVGAAADKLLDFQNSINNEMEASVLFGKDINFTRARELSYAGDLAGLAKEQSRILKEVGDLRKLDAFQTKALAESMGLSVDQLIKMNAKQQELNELRRKNPDLAAQYEKDLNVLEKTNETLEEKYKREIQSRQIASQQQKIMNDIQQIIVELSEVLLPVVKLFMGILVPIVKIGAGIIKFILTPIRLINDGIEEWYKNSEGVRSTFNKIFVIMQEMWNWMDTNSGKIVGGIVGSIVIIGYVIKKQLIENMIDYLKLFKSLPTAVPTPTTPTGLGPGGFGGYGSTVSVPPSTGTPPPSIPPAAGNVPQNVGSVSNSANKIEPTAGQKIKDFLKNLSDGIKSFTPISEILKGLAGITLSGPAFLAFIPAIPGLLLMAGVGALSSLITAGFTALSAGIKMMDINVIGKGLLGIAGLGVAIIPFAYSMSLFSNIDWIGVMAGIAALVSFSAAAFGLGFLLSGPGAILFGAGVIGIAALGTAMLPLGYAAKLAGEGMKNFGTGIKDITSNVSSLISLKETLSIFKDEEIIDGIYAMGDAIGYLNNKLEGLGIKLPAIKEINKTKTEETRNNEIVVKLDELITLMKNGGIGVNIDGTRLNTALGINVKFRGANGTS